MNATSNTSLSCRVLPGAARMLAGFGMAFAMALPSAVIAAECRETKSVLESAQSIQKNKDSGGHIAMHFVGHDTEAGKSQYNTFADFQTVWQAWQNYTRDRPKPKTCGSSTRDTMDCVKAEYVGLNAAYVCDEVDSPKGKKVGPCKAGHEIVPQAVAFRYAKSSVNDKWILNTTYPSVNLDCQ